MLVFAIGADAQPAVNAPVRPGPLSAVLSSAVILLCLACLALWLRAVRAECQLTAARAKHDGFIAGLVFSSTPDASARWCTCGCWLGPPRAQRDLCAQAVPFQAGTGAWPIYAAPVVAPEPDGVPAPPAGNTWRHRWTYLCVAGLCVFVFWLGVGLLSLGAYVCSPSRRRSALQVRRRVITARPLPTAKRPLSVCRFVPPPPSLALLGEGGDVSKDNVDCSAPPCGTHAPMLSDQEFGRLAKAGVVPHPRSWGDTSFERGLHAHLAGRARELRPDTVGERQRRTDPDWIRFDHECATTDWPHWNIEKGEVVVINGLVTRPDLEFAVAKVTGLCYRSKRIGVHIAKSDEKMLVLIEKLTPTEDGDVSYIADIMP